MNVTVMAGVGVGDGVRAGVGTCEDEDKGTESCSSFPQVTGSTPWRGGLLVVLKLDWSPPDHLS